MLRVSQLLQSLFTEPVLALKLHMDGLSFVRSILRAREYELMVPVTGDPWYSGAVHAKSISGERANSLSA